MSNKKIVIYGGGTISYVRNHLALAARGYGNTAEWLGEIFANNNSGMDIDVKLTKMAFRGSQLETNEDVSQDLDKIIADPTTKIVVMSCALCDFDGTVNDEPSGKYEQRLDSNVGYTIKMMPADKLIGKIRKDRKDIFLVGFKNTCGLSEQDQYIAGLRLCKKSSCNLVFCNDAQTRLNMVITPEEAKYHVTTNRRDALYGLVEMTLLRSHLTHTRSTVISGNSVPWDSPEVPTVLRTVVDYCIRHHAYKPFNGSTTGHFACKLSDDTFLTSKRRTNFNRIYQEGLVKIKTNGPDTVLAYGAKPSVGGQSQRIVFNDHKEMDCIVHFHCPIKEGSAVPVVSQREFECGSHECGDNTSKGLMSFGSIKAVYLDNHGPNIVFHHSVDPQLVIDFIEQNFDLSNKTGGYVSPMKVCPGHDPNRYSCAKMIPHHIDYCPTCEKIVEREREIQFQENWSDQMSRHEGRYGSF